MAKETKVINKSTSPFGEYVEDSMVRVFNASSSTFYNNALTTIISNSDNTSQLAFEARKLAQENDAKKYKGKTFGWHDDTLPVGPVTDDATSTLIRKDTDINYNVLEHTALSYNLANRMNAQRDGSSTDYTRFARTPYLDPFTSNTTTREYIFITKPDLNLFKVRGNPNPELVKHSAFFADALARYPEVAYQLQFSVNGANSGPFMPLLSNAFNGHVDLPGISADTYETASNVYGYHMNYRGSSYTSDYEPEVSIDFRDNKWLEVYMLLKMYDEYERLKWLGLVSPTTYLYIFRKILYDQVSMYKIIVGDDGMSILYWARYTGGTLTSVPRDTFSDLADGEITLSTNWKFHWVEDMNPNILVDFNRISMPLRQRCKTLVPLFDKENQMPSAVWPRCPYIGVNRGNDLHGRYNKYFLLWYD